MQAKPNPSHLQWKRENAKCEKKHTKNCELGSQCFMLCWMFLEAFGCVCFNITINITLNLLTQYCCNTVPPL